MQEVEYVSLLGYDRSNIEVMDNYQSKWLVVKRRVCTRKQLIRYMYGLFRQRCGKYIHRHPSQVRFHFFKRSRYGRPIIMDQPDEIQKGISVLVQLIDMISLLLLIWTFLFFFCS